MKPEDLYKENSISYKKYLRTFYGIGSNKMEGKKFTHAQLKQVFPFLELSSFDGVASDRESIFRGDIIMVRDGYHNLAPYIVPRVECEDYGELTVTFDNGMEVIYTGIKELNLTELYILAHKLKKCQKYDEAKKVNRMLKAKKDPKVKSYKRRKALLIKESREDYEEYKRR